MGLNIGMKHKRGKYYTYFCEKCKESISEMKLEKAIIDDLLSLKELEDLNNSTVALEKYQDDLKHAAKQLKSLNAERKKYIALYAKGMISEKELESFIDELDGRIKYFTNLLVFDTILRLGKKYR